MGEIRTVISKKVNKEFKTMMISAAENGIDFKYIHDPKEDSHFLRFNNNYDMNRVRFWTKQRMG